MWSYLWGDSPKWQQQVMFGLALAAWVEGPFFYSDLVRGMAVGLAIGALVAMLAARYVMPAVACAGLVVAAFMMKSHLNPPEATVICAHVLAAFALLAPIASIIHRAWRTQRPTRVLVH